MGSSVEGVVSKAGQQLGWKTSTSKKKEQQTSQRMQAETEEREREKKEQAADEKRRKRMNIFRAEEGDVAVGGNRSSIFGN